MAYIVSDMARSEPFYREVLGMDVGVPWGGREKGHVPFTEFEVGATTVSLTQLPQPPMHGIMALAVDDAKAAIEELRGRG